MKLMKLSERMLEWVKRHIVLLVVLDLLLWSVYVSVSEGYLDNILLWLDAQFTPAANAQPTHLEQNAPSFAYSFLVLGVVLILLCGARRPAPQ